MKRLNKIDQAYHTECFRTELLIALSWDCQSITIKELCTCLNASRSKVNYHLKALEKLGQVEIIRSTRPGVPMRVSIPDISEFLVEEVDYGRIIRESDGHDFGPASRMVALRTERRSRRFGHHGVLIHKGFRCFLEPPVQAA